MMSAYRRSHCIQCERSILIILMRVSNKALHCRRYKPSRFVIGAVLLSVVGVTPLTSETLQRTGAATQPQATTTSPQTPKPPTHADILRGEYGRYRANNDLLFYDLDIRVDPDKKFVSGKNTIRFRMLKDDTRIQLDLYDNLKVDKIVLKGPKSKVQSL